MGEYEGDESPGGPSYFFSLPEKWGYSSTGAYIGVGEIADYKVTNKYPSNETYPGVFQTGRIAAVSLKYYGLCLQKGSYKVKLHFAELLYSNDRTFSSLGKRIFDVSIQVSKSRITLLEYFLLDLLFM